MREYWLRILGAWVLLQAASRVMKGAEKMLADTATTRPSTEVSATDG